MEAKYRRKERKAKTEESGESSVPLLKSAIADKAERNNSFLPSNQDNAIIVTIEDVVSGYNMHKALVAVKRNKGAPGIDGITVNEIEKVLQQQWPEIRQKILEGQYRPSPVRRVEISKPDGSGVRKLGIPTVMDRIIQQAICQILVPIFDPTFSPYSYGFRPKRNAKQAVLQAQRYLRGGCEWVVDIDLEKFFDKVNHDMLMARVARRIKDKKSLLLIRRYLQAGVMENGLIEATEEGTPQGGPLSPLLSNILLDDLDKNLEKRGLRFVRYADDCNIYVKSERAANRVMNITVKYLHERLKLKVNQQKSAVDHPWKRKFLGFTFREKGGQVEVHKSRIKRFKDKIRSLTKKMRGSNITDSIRKYIMPVIRGWINYFGIVEGRSLFGSLDGWIRRKIRGLIWRQWKNCRTRLRKLRSFGLKENMARKTAYSSKGPWRMARTYAVQKAISNAVIEEMGYMSMMSILKVRLI